MLNTRDIIFFQFFQNLEYLQWTNKKGKKYEIGFLRRMYNSDRKWVSKLGKFLYSLNFVHEYYNYHQVYYAVIISIDERNSVESTISKKIRKLSFEPGVENGGFFHVVFISRSTGCRGALYHPPAPPFTLNRIDDRFVGWEKLCTRHTPGEISLGAETGPGALVSNTKWITPPLYQEKRRETSVAALTIWRGI